MIPAYGLIKLSVIFFYRRLFVKGTNSRFDSITKASIVIVILWTIAFFFAHVFACGVYVSNTWGPLIDLKHCANGDVIANGLFISDFLSDLLVLVLPMPIVSNGPVDMVQCLQLIAEQIARLHMSTTRKLNVIAVLMLGTMSVLLRKVEVFKADTFQVLLCIHCQDGVQFPDYRGRVGQENRCGR